MHVTIRQLIITVIIMLVVLGFILLHPRTAAEGLGTMTTTEGQLLELTNGEREVGLRWNQCLAQQARKRAEFLVVNEYWAHYTADGSTPWQFIKPCRYLTAGENLARDFDDVTELHAALMASPTHRANITNAVYTDVGIGCYQYICVEFFTKTSSL